MSVGVAPGEWIYYPGSKGPFNVTHPSGVGDVSHPESFDVGEVRARESKPKGLLRKLPWKLEADRSTPGVDAIVRFNFYVTAGIPTLTAPKQPTQDQLIPRGWRAQLQVSGTASSSVMYKAEAVPLEWEGRHVGRKGNS